MAAGSVTPFRLNSAIYNMPLTLLLDLDDTLLNNDINQFLPHYLQALGKHLANHVAPQKMARELMSATSIMSANQNPGVTLEETFDRSFYPKIGVSKQDLRGSLTSFYEEVFPSLSFITSQRPAAVQMVNSALEKGHQVVIATNPLFPLRAIEHRLDWAGLKADRARFALVTSYEGFHFAKPNPAFYAEILARLGWPAAPAVMVGNSLDQDLLPAAALNLPGFWLSDQPDPLPDSLPPLSRKGKLEDLGAWLDEVQAASPLPDFQTPQGILAALISTPAALDTLARSLSPEAWALKPGEGEWCFTEIICHLRDSDREINIPRFERILGEATVFLASDHADTWVETRDYCSEPGAQVLQEFIQSRIALTRVLEKVLPDDWERSARHSIFGPTNLKELVLFIIQHDQTHIQQAQKTIQQVRSQGARN